MASVTSTSQCPRCNAPLSFNPETGTLVCEYCDSVFTPDEIEAVNAAKQQKASDAFRKEQAQSGGVFNPPSPESRVDWASTAADEGADGVGGSFPDASAGAGDRIAAGTPVAAGNDGGDFAGATENAGSVGAVQPEVEVISSAEKAQCMHSNWDDSTIASDWGEDANDICTYTCSSCGGEILCEKTTGATQCPFCGNPTFIPGKFSIGLRPNYVLPFKLNKEEAEAALRRHYRSKLFLPKEFTNENQIKKLQGTYVPFWLFNGTCAAECKYHATTSTSYREGDYIVTNTRHYLIDRNGVMTFDKVPADASSKMPDDMMDSIEPFDYSELKPFTMSYLPGFIADRYDVGIEECSPRADGRCENSTVGMLTRDVRGYESVKLTGKNVYINRLSVDYALLPVYTMKTQFKDKTYLFAMNGQTGKFVGDLPVSKSRFWAFCIALTIVIAAVLYLVGAGNAIADIIWQLSSEG